MSRRAVLSVLSVLWVLWVLSVPFGAAAAEPARAFRAGAHALDITPQKFPVVVSGGFLEQKATKAHSPLHVRALVLDDGSVRVAIAVVDTLAMSRKLIDAAKELAQKATGIPPERLLITATHTHSAPSVMGALGTGVQEDYAKDLPGQVAKCIELAAKNLAPAKVGWAVADAPDHTHCRRWITRPDRMLSDPFGQRTVRAMMHPGYQNPAYVGPAGPADTGLTLLSVQSPDGRPIALLANYSMHYFGAAAVSADYFGLFCARLAKLLGADRLEPPFVAMMSQGTAGDLHWMDYSQPPKKLGIQAYTDSLAQLAHETYKTIEHRAWVPLAASEKKLKLARRVPDEKRLAWAKDLAAKMGDRPPKSQQEVYAREAICLHNEPTRELRLQALRVGDLGIAAIPCEVFGITGLKIKAQSPLEPTMNLELANGAEGYIPPPEQHKLGGYTTWPARSAGLEAEAEPKIVEALLQCLEEAAGKPRRQIAESRGPYAQAVLASKPLAYWRMEEFGGPTAADATGHCPATYEGGIAFYLDGPEGRDEGRGTAGMSNAECRMPNAESMPNDKRRLPASGKSQDSASDIGSSSVIRHSSLSLSALPRPPSRLPTRSNPFSGEAVNRAPHFAGGGMKAAVKGLGNAYTVELWFWSGLPNDARAEMGCLFRRVPGGNPQAPGDQLSLGGTKYAQGKLYLFNAADPVKTYLFGATEIPPKTWHHVALVRDGRKGALYLDGKLETSGEVGTDPPAESDEILIGGGRNAFEGKLDEVAIYPRALPADELARHIAAALPPP